MFTAYAEFAIDLVVNIAAIFLLAYVLYFRRHRRADLLLAYVALNIGIFVAISLLTTVRVDIALGFGLFAILSIIRLRSTLGDPAGGRLLLRRPGDGPGQRDGHPGPPAGRADQRAAAGRHGDRRQQGAARAHPAHGRPPGRGPRRRRLAGRRPGAAPGRHGAAPRGQRRRLRAPDHAGRRALPGRDAPRRWRPWTSGSSTSRWTWSTPTTRRWSPTWSTGWAGRCCATSVKDIDYVRDTMEVEVTYRVWTPVAPHPNPATHTDTPPRRHRSAATTEQIMRRSRS